MYKCSFWTRNKAENIFYSTEMVGTWFLDQKDAGSNLLRILLFLLYFNAEGCWFESGEQ